MDDTLEDGGGRSMLWRLLHQDGTKGGVDDCSPEHDVRDVVANTNHPTDMARTTALASTPVSPTHPHPHYHRAWQARTDSPSLSHSHRRGSLQLMQEINLQQFPHPHHHHLNAGGGVASPVAVPPSPLAAATAAGTGTALPNHNNNTPHLLHLHHDMDDVAVLDAMMTTSKRRVARELLPMSGMRSKRSIVDPRSLGDGNNKEVSSMTAADSMDYDFDHDGYADDGDDDNEDFDFNDMYLYHDHGGEDHGRRDRSPSVGSLPQEQTHLVGTSDPERRDDRRSTSYGTTTSNGSRSSTGAGGGKTVPPEYQAASLLLPPMRHATSTGGTANASVRPSDAGSIPAKRSGKPRAPLRHHAGWVAAFVQQTAAVAIVGILNMMIAIPFGASYFPIGWKAAVAVDELLLDSEANATATADDVDGSFPLPGKQALGLRMFLFATMMGQLVFTFQSRFVNAVGLQMVENVPFLHALAYAVIARQGYGEEALSTLFFLFGVSSIVVGGVFYLLGRLRLGKLVYFFPNHVLVGCIGGIGVFILFTAAEVTTNVPFQLSLEGLESLVEHWYLLWVVLAFEASLRLLMWATQDELGRPKWQLLTPTFYISITPIFYLGLWIAGISMDRAREIGYFFPATNTGTLTTADEPTSPWMDPHLWDIFRVVDFGTISWMAVLESTGTMVALAAFSLIHVPINIPAFAISTDVETDMNAELIAHGWSNGLSGIFGGLQNYMTYSNSVLYAKTGGKGKMSSLGIVLVTAALFVVGPSICDYLPRCMAGTLLLHIGIDLVLEGVYDSYGQYDILEYAGIWFILVVMTVSGMTAALAAGIISALSTYAVQSINYHNPIRQILTASTLRSSAWARCAQARAILEDDKTGRARILIFQLQGHLFFGNVAQLTDTIKDVLREKKGEDDLPIVVIIDFTLVVGMDSSAAHAVAKLKKILHRLFHVEISIFVTGSDRGGFPCEFALSEALAPSAQHARSQPTEAPPPHTPQKGGGAERQELDWNDVQAQQAAAGPQEQHPSAKQLARGSVSVSAKTASILASKAHGLKTDGRVCESLDDALTFAEDILIAREDPTIDSSTRSIYLDELLVGSGPATTNNLTLEEEKVRAKKYLRDLFPDDAPEDLAARSVDLIVSRMVREEFHLDSGLWEQGDESDSLKILVSGELVSIIDETGASERVSRGNMVGEFCLVHGTKRLTTLVCASPVAVLYSLDVVSWRELKVQEPNVASLIDGIVIRYLAHRVQHVSNRYFHTTLPV